MSLDGSASAGRHWWEAPPGAVRSPGARPAPPPPRPPGPAAAPTPVSPRRTRRPPVLTVAAAACVAAPPLILVGAPVWARFPAVLLVLALAPGAALLRLLDRRMELGLAMGISLAVSAAIAQGMVWAGAWHPKLFVCLLAGVCLACMAGARLRKPGRRWIRHRAPEAESSPSGAAGATPRRGWDLVRRRGRPAGLVPVPEPLGSGERPHDASIASIRVRTHGDPAALALALRALLSLEGGRGERDGQEPPLVLRAAPRRFSAEYKLEILREAEACTRKGELTALLRREGLYTSHLAAWRKKRDEGELHGSAAARRAGR
jgi:hypothetical protein